MRSRESAPCGVEGEACAHGNVSTEHLHMIIYTIYILYIIYKCTDRADARSLRALTRVRESAWPRLASSVAGPARPALPTGFARPAGPPVPRPSADGRVRRGGPGRGRRRPADCTIRGWLRPLVLVQRARALGRLSHGCVTAAPRHAHHVPSCLYRGPARLGRADVRVQRGGPGRGGGGRVGQLRGGRDPRRDARHLLRPQGGA
jgi:hypothetical protein